MDIKNNLISKQLAVKYPHCISDIPTRHRNNYSIFLDADDARNRMVEPDADNMLKITNDGKKLALDQRLINSLLPDNPDSKFNVCVKNVFVIWDKTKDDR